MFFENDPEKPKFSLLELQQLKLPGLEEALDKFIKQKGSFQGITDTLKESASQKMSALDELFPGYKAGITKTQQVAEQESQGLLPADVASAISRTSAFKGLSTGLQGGSGSRSTIEARDMGMTSYDMVNRGLSRMQNLRGEANAMMPLQAMNLAFTPQAIRQEDVSLAQYNNNITNQQAIANNQIQNQQALSDFRYNQQYGGSPWGAIGGGVLGAGLGVLAAPFTNGMSIPMGMAMGSTLGGASGGGQGNAYGSALSGVGIAGGNMMSQAKGANGLPFQFPNFYTP